MSLKRPDYITYTNGRLSELYCKICGTQIGGEVSRLTGKRHINDVEVHDHVLEFVRFPQYTEAKIEFEDGSFHITLGCSKCLTTALQPGVLDEMHQADLGYLASADLTRYGTRKAKRILVARVGGGIT